MTDQIREQLSALLDDELPRDEIGLLVRRLDRDPELRRALGSYALIGETLRAPGGRLASPGFAARVTAALEGNDVAAVPTQSEPRRIAARASGAALAFWKRPAVRTALAASAAAAAVLVFRPATAPEQVAAVPIDAYPVRISPTPDQSQRMAAYLVTHSQYSSPMSRRNVLSGVLAADPGLVQQANYVVIEGAR